MGVGSGACGGQGCKRRYSVHACAIEGQPPRWRLFPTNTDSESTWWPALQDPCGSIQNATSVQGVLEDLEPWSQSPQNPAAPVQANSELELRGQANYQKIESLVEERDQLRRERDMLAVEHYRLRQGTQVGFVGPQEVAQETWRGREEGSRRER